MPALLATIAVALGIIEPSPGLAAGAAALLIVLDVAGWRVVATLFDRERLITGIR